MCTVCIEVDDYINKIVEELNFSCLVVGNQLLTHKLKAKLKDDRLNTMVELRKLEGISKSMLGKVLVDPTKVATKL